MALETVKGDRAAVVLESADLLYQLSCSGPSWHLACGIWEEMDRREQTLGLAEGLPKVAERGRHLD